MEKHIFPFELHKMKNENSLLKYIYVRRTSFALIFKNQTLCFTLRIWTIHLRIQLQIK